MLSTSYFVIHESERDIIVHVASGIRVKVFGLEVDEYVPDQNEIHVFGDDHGEWLAFETEGWNGEGLDIISQAVVWYARYLDYPQMQIMTEDPRPVNKLRVVSRNL
jgi:hypothetical protein